MALARWRILRRFPASSVLVSLPGGRREGASAVVKSLSASASHCGEDKVTHTGQKWENDDYRNLRFIDREKKVNDQFAMDLLAEEPVVSVQGGHTWCDGGGGALGHPRVYINLDKPEINECGYCGKRFISEKNKTQFPKETFVSQ